jgi:hypothetical protein
VELVHVDGSVRGMGRGRKGGEFRLFGRVKAAQVGGR